MTISCFPKDQNGDSHHVGDLKIPGKEFLSLPARSKKYREHQSSSERKSQGSSTSPLDTSEVRVQVSQSVGRCFFSSSTDLGVSYSIFILTSFLTWYGGAVWPIGWKTEPAYSSVVDCMGNCRQIILAFWASALLSIKQNNGTNLHHELVYKSLVFSGGIGNLLLRDECLDLNFPEFVTVRMRCLEFQKNTEICNPCCVEPDLISLLGFMRSGLVAFEKQSSFQVFDEQPKMLVAFAKSRTLGVVPSHLLITLMVSRVATCRVFSLNSSIIRQRW